MGDTISVPEPVPVPVNETLQLKPVIEALMNFGQQFCSLTLANQERDLAKKRLDDQLEETDKMRSILEGWPSFKEEQKERRTEAEKNLKKYDEKLAAAMGSITEAATAVASLLVTNHTSAIDDSTKLLPERYQKLEEKVKDLEKTVAGMDQRDEFSKINDRFRDSQANYSEAMKKIKTNEALITGKIQTSEAKITREYQLLSDKYTKLDQTTRTEFISRKTCLDNHEISIKKHEELISASNQQMITLRQQMNTLQQQTGAVQEQVSHSKKHEESINALRQQMTTLQQQISEQTIAMKAKDNDVDQVAKKTANLEQLLAAHKASLEVLDSSDYQERLNKLEHDKTSLVDFQNAHTHCLEVLDSSNYQERLIKLEEDKASVVDLQNAHKAILENVENCQRELKTLQDKVVQFENIRQTPPVSNPQIPSRTFSGSSATMNSMLQTKLSNVQGDLKLINERLTKIESSSELESRALSHDDALINAQLNNLNENYESRLATLEDSMKKVHSPSVQNTMPKISPFSAAAQDLAALKEFEFYRDARNSEDQATNRRLEELNNELQSFQRNSMTLKEQVNAITRKSESINTIQASMEELLQNLNRLSQSISEVDNRLNILANNQNGNTIAITHLNNRVVNISTEGLAKNMLGQLEAIYPNVRNAERLCTELRNQYSDHTNQLEQLKTRMGAFENQTSRKQSPAVVGNNRVVETLRQEVDSLTRDKISDKKTITAIQTSLSALEKAHTALEVAIEDLNKNGKKRDKAYKENLSDLINAIADLSAKVEVKDDSQIAGDDSTSARSTLPLNRQSPAGENVLNGKKRKTGTHAESPTSGGSINGYTQSPSKKRAKTAEDNNEELE